MQHWETVLTFLRAHKDPNSPYYDDMSLDQICSGLPNLPRETIQAALKDLEYSGDVMPESIRGYPKTWQALT